MFLQDKDKETLINFLKENLSRQVNLKFFTQELECETCHSVHLLLEEVTALSPFLRLDIYNFLLDKDKVNLYGIDKIPAIVVEGEKDYGIRFYGMPTGYEFSGFIETLIWVSRGETDLKKESKEFLSSLTHEVNIQTFVTVTCPYCPQAVVLGHKMAIEGEKVRSAMIEAEEFPHLTYRYGVRAVPKIVINEQVSFEGAVPEEYFLTKIIEAVS